MGRTKDNEPLCTVEELGRCQRCSTLTLVITKYSKGIFSFPGISQVISVFPKHTDQCGLK